MMRWIAVLVLALGLAACATSKPTEETAKETTEETTPDDKAASQPSVASVFDAAPAAGDQARCPVSGEVFTVSAETTFAEHEGKHVAFCCAGCKPKFEADPAKFVSQ